MRTVGILKELKMQCRYTTFNLILYFICICLWMFIISFNLINLFYNPFLINGIVLEMSVLLLILCSYLFFKNKKYLDSLKGKIVEINSRKKYRRNYL